MLGSDRLFVSGSSLGESELPGPSATSHADLHGMAGLSRGRSGAAVKSLQFTAIGPGLIPGDSEAALASVSSPLHPFPRAFGSLGANSPSFHGLLVSYRDGLSVKDWRAIQ